MRYPYLLLALVSLAFPVAGQTPAPNESSAADQILALTKKIDEQSLKIDALSQQLLRIEQQLGQAKNPTASSPVAATPETSPPVAVPAGPTHIVTKGETLTSIAHMHKVSIGELQKINHIEDDRKLQIGQTLVIPGAQTGSPSPSATPTPNE